MTSLMAMRRRAMKVAASGPAVSDTFNRPDSTTTMGNADTGQAWVPNSGVWGIDVNRATLVSATSQATTVVDSGLADGTVEVTLAMSGSGVGLCFRSTDDNNHYVVESANGSIFRRQAGAYTSLGVSVNYASGVVMEVALSGSSIVLKHNGSAVLGATDTFQATAVKHGLRSDNNTTARFENFSVTA